MLAFDGTDTLVALTDRFPKLVAVFDDLGINRLQPEQTLAEAIAEAELDPTLALAHIASTVELNRSWHEDDWGCIPLDELADHISQCHHTYSRECLGQLRALVAVIASSPEGSKQRETWQRFLAFAQQLEEHMSDEEQHLFAQCRLLEQNPRRWLRKHTNLNELTSQLTSHHDQLELQLARLMALSQQTPWGQDHIAYHRTFIHTLENLEHDLVAHTYLEYEYLMPGAIHLAKLERSRAESHITARVPKGH